MLVRRVVEVVDPQTHFGGLHLSHDESGAAFIMGNATDHPRVTGSPAPVAQMAGEPGACRWVRSPTGIRPVGWPPTRPSRALGLRGATRRAPRGPPRVRPDTRTRRWRRGCHQRVDQQEPEGEQDQQNPYPRGTAAHSSTEASVPAVAVAPANGSRVIRVPAARPTAARRRPAGTAMPRLRCIWANRRI